ncbi:MAG: CDP-glucose 4,6-dehydratase [Bdellovibrionaceae bacterium]|nr:CDP-glucose 4,6-dehydratase [Pseudobdellovibrionaceae bacterium]|tara:strand:- start:8732 stop:9799 length:1068 start_codon:yes stop_codon:yes gene_type:complete
MLNFWKNKKVFLTGHTGFKGSWMTQVLLNLGADVKGYALAPSTEKNHYHSISLGSKIQEDIADLRDYQKLKASIQSYQPDVVFHLAAQPLVRYSYHNPLETYEVNVMGTANLLNACREIESIKSIVAITTDKCYENKEWIWPYRETDRLGGHDPYSNSKACCELVIDAYSKSFFYDKEVGLASARAGNVIGGGDWSEDRLLPDIVRSYFANESVSVRSPNAIRPWQHVLEPIYGYMLLAEKIYSTREFNGGYNFGPTDNEQIRVIDILNLTKEFLGEDFQFEVHENSDLHEAGLLSLDSAKAVSQLNWKPKWSGKEAIEMTLKWFKEQNSAPHNTEKLTNSHIDYYFSQGQSPQS